MQKQKQEEIKLRTRLANNRGVLVMVLKQVSCSEIKGARGIEEEEGETTQVIHLL